jgi:hypothetical protein
MRILVVALLFAAACGGSSSGGDAGVNIPDSLCTTTACATNPCDVGCKFSSSTSTACEAKVATKKVTACGGFCGLFPADSLGGSILGCWHYDYSTPECNTCGYHGSCYVLDEPGVDYTAGGAICPANCGPGGPLEDAGVTCPDMAIGD